MLTHVSLYGSMKASPWCASSVGGEAARVGAGGVLPSCTYTQILQDGKEERGIRRTKKEVGDEEVSS